MKTVLSGILSLTLLLLGCGSAMAESAASGHRLLYQGHGSLRIVTAEGKVIYIDPYVGEGYDLPADLILITHGHQDHNNVDVIKQRNDDCRVITWKEALVKGDYKTFDFGYATVEAVQAGNNRNHDIKVCVGWLATPPPRSRWKSSPGGIFIMRFSAVTGSTIWIWRRQSPARSW